MGSGQIAQKKAPTDGVLPEVVGPHPDITGSPRTAVEMWSPRPPLVEDCVVGQPPTLWKRGLPRNVPSAKLASRPVYARTRPTRPAPARTVRTHAHRTTYAAHMHSRAHVHARALLARMRGSMYENRDLTVQGLRERARNTEGRGDPEPTMYLKGTP